MVFSTRLVFILKIIKTHAQTLREKRQSYFILKYMVEPVIFALRMVTVKKNLL
jgi:hypothetical protein